MVLVFEAGQAHKRNPCFGNQATGNCGHLPVFKKVIWVVCPGAWLMDPSWLPVQSVLRHIPDANGVWRVNPDHRGRTWVALDANRDAIFGDLFRRIAAS